MSEQTAENGAPPCDVFGKPATTSDGICGAELCDAAACLDEAWDRAFTSVIPPESSAS